MPLKSEERFAEVIETNSINFTAQCYQLYNTPPLGSIIKAGEPGILAIIHSIKNGPVDAGRRVFPRGIDEENEAQIYRNHPQLKLLLSTQIEGLVIGYYDGATIRIGLPPNPSHLHAFVSSCDRSEVMNCTQDFSIVRMLLRAAIPAVDEILIAFLSLAASSHNEPDQFLLGAGKSLVTELSHDMIRLNALLRRLTP